MKLLLEKLIEVQTELKAPKNQRNSFGNYNYRSCEDILESVKPLLCKNNLSLVISDSLVNVGDRYYIKATARLMCAESCDVIESEALAREPLSKKGADESQITGATSSYARKHALNGLFAIDDTKDADATNTHEKIKEQPKTESQKLMDKIKKAGVDVKSFAKFAQLSKDDPMTTTLCLKNFDSMIEQFKNENS